MEKPEQSAASSSAGMAAPKIRTDTSQQNLARQDKGEPAMLSSSNTAKWQVYQFKITLQESSPQIWRRILVPGDYNFWQLHVAIQTAMGWHDCHLHKFQMLPESSNPDDIGIADDHDDPFFPRKTLSGKKVAIASCFKSPGDRAIYEYDFGDGWEHDILLEQIVPPIAGTMYPRCINGMRACPPEDCGGVYGYKNMLEILTNPRHDEYDHYMDWLGGDFDPNAFDPTDVIFRNAKAL